MARVLIFFRAILVVYIRSESGIPRVHQLLAALVKKGPASINFNSGSSPFLRDKGLSIIRLPASGRRDSGLLYLLHLHLA